MRTRISSTGAHKSISPTTVVERTVHHSFIKPLSYVWYADCDSRGGRINYIPRGSREDLVKTREMINAAGVDRN